MVMEQIVVPLVVPGQNPILILMLTIKLETLAPFWAISNVPIHHTFELAWEKLVILDQI